MTEETIQIMYNVFYGELSPSDKAVAIYNERMKKIDPNYKPVVSYGLYEIKKRHDANLLQIYHEIGEEFDTYYSKTQIKVIPKKYENYYYIQEKDGIEHVIVDTVKYELDEKINNIKLVLQRDISNDDKINELNQLLFV